jgi:hypothetical protein
MERTKRLLIVIENSAASKRTLRCFTIVLIHMLGPIPTQLKESRGAETPREEENVEAALVKEHNRFLKKSADEVGSVLENARAMLMRAQVPAEAIEWDCPELSNGEDFVNDILRTARRRDCGTIVIGRESVSGLKEFFADHAADS